jgi:hypothetical protein
VANGELSPIGTEEKCGKVQPGQPERVTYIAGKERWNASNRGAGAGGTAIRDIHQ